MTVTKPPVIPDPTDLPEKARKWARAVTEFLESQYYSNQQNAVNITAVQKATTAVQTASEIQATQISEIDNTVRPIAPPPVPTGPSLSSTLASVAAYWDGQFEVNVVTEGSQAIAVDTSSVAGVIAEAGPSTSGPFYAVGSMIAAGGSANFPTNDVGLSPGATIYVRFRAVAYNGLMSEPSTVRSILIEGVKTAELSNAVNTSITNAQTTANNAQTAATNAQTTASNAQTAATNAATAASAAQADADQALTDAATAAGIAAGKGKVIVQSTAPAVADQLAQNLWIDTTGGA